MLERVIFLYIYSLHFKDYIQINSEIIVKKVYVILTNILDTLLKCGIIVIYLLY